MWWHTKKRRQAVVYFTNSYNGLSIVKEVVQQTIGGKQPAIAYLAYDEYSLLV
jgi:hypothetical protein